MGHCEDHYISRNVLEDSWDIWKRFGCQPQSFIVFRHVRHHESQMNRFDLFELSHVRVLSPFDLK